MLETGNFGQA